MTQEKKEELLDKIEEKFPNPTVLVISELLDQVTEKQVLESLKGYQTERSFIKSLELIVQGKSERKKQMNRNPNKK